MKKFENLIFLMIIFITSLNATPIVIDSNVSVNSNTCDKITWTDSSGLQRIASIVQINGNPAGFKGGYFTQLTYYDGASQVICNESDPNSDLSGLGFMIDHVIYQKAGYTGRGWINSKQDGIGGTTNIIFAGANHIIYEVEMDEYGDDGNHSAGTWKVKWMYMIRTGNDYIVDSIAYDFSSVPYGTWGNDIRSPYCELNWTGTGASNTLTESIDGIEYCAADSNGISYIFKTRSSSPFSDGYTYNTPGRNIPYTLSWKNSPDREFGYISTFDLIQQAAGGGFTSESKIGSESSSMPANWGINYQFNGFQNWYGDKMTWQMPYGAAGGESNADGTVHEPDFPDWTWRKRWNAYPTIGFTLLIHYGKHTDDNVRKLVNEIADIHSLTNPLTATIGSIPTTGKMHLYDSSNTFTLKPAGYNHIYHAWEVNCVSDTADVTLNLGSVNLKNQTFIFNNYNSSTMPVIKLNNVTQTEDTDIFTSLDTTNKKLYVTFNKTLTGSANIILENGNNTPTPTPTSIGSDCIYYQIDRSAVPSMVFMKKLTLKINIGDCSGCNVYVDGQPVSSTYNPTTNECIFTAEGSDIVISRTNYTGGATYAVTKATLYNDKKWAYSLDFDDGRPNVRSVAKPVLDQYGYKAGVAIITRLMSESTDGYVMSWQSIDALYAAGWSVLNSNEDTNGDGLQCSEIESIVVPAKQAIENRYPGYINTHYIYPYCVTDAWECLKNSGYLLSAGQCPGDGINYADTLAEPFLLKRNILAPGGNLRTGAEANAAADSAAADSRSRWMIVFTHNVEPGSTTPGTYDTNETELTTHISYLYNTYGAGGLDNMWFAPSDEVMQYIFTREYSTINFLSQGVCGPLQTPTFTPTIPPGATSTFTFTPTETPVYSECLMDDLEDNNNANLFGGSWYTYTSADPAHPDETTIWPASGDYCSPTAGGASASFYAMRITGTVGAINDPYYPCIGIGSQLNSNAGPPSYQETDLSSCVGISFYIKGDGKSYFVKVPYTNSSGQTLTGYDDYKWTFTAPSNWTLISVNFSSFTQGGWGTAVDLNTVLQHAKEIQWQTNFNGSAGSPASAELWIDDIKILGCSSCPNNPTLVPTNSSTATQTFTSINTFTQTNTSTSTMTFTNTNTLTETVTDTSTPTETLTGTPTNTSTLTDTWTATNTFTNTFTQTNTWTASFTNTITNTSTETGTDTPTPTGTWYTSTPTNTSTSTDTWTVTNTFTQTNTWTASFTNTITNTSTETETDTPTPTETLTGTPTNTSTSTDTWTATNTFTQTNTWTASFTNTITTNVIGTSTQTPIFTNTFTQTPTQTISQGKFKFENEEIVPYPNPVSGKSDVRIRYKTKGEEEQITLRIYTNALRLIKEISFGKSKIIKNTDGTKELVIPNYQIRDFAQGVYYYILVAKDKDNLEIKSKVCKMAIIK